MTTPFSMLDETPNYIIASIGSNPKEVIQHIVATRECIQHIVATRECIMRNGPSNHSSGLSPIEMTVDILMEGFLDVFIQDPEYKNRDPVFVRDVAQQLVITLVQHYNKTDDICDKYVDYMMGKYNQYNDPLDNT